MGNFISHVQVPARNLEASIEWYEKVMGGTFVANFGQFAIIELSEGACIHLWLTNDPTTSTFTVNGAPYPTIGIQCDNIEAIIAAVKQYGSDYEGEGLPTIDEEGGKFFRFFDPTGNMIVAHEEPADDAGEETEQAVEEQMEEEEN